jgi:hypothetical protein
LDKVQQKLNKKMDSSAVLAQNFISLNNDGLSESLSRNPIVADHVANNPDVKEKTKISDIIKSQKRLRIYHECLHVPMFPICYMYPATRQQRSRILREKLQLTDERILHWYQKESVHRQLNHNSCLSLSNTFHEIPCYFMSYFCPSHVPLNPNIVKKTTSYTNDLPSCKLRDESYTKPNQTTPYISSMNFNINNSYRISFLDEYWALLGNKLRVRNAMM